VPEHLANRCHPSPLLGHAPVVPLLYQPVALAFDDLTVGYVQALLPFVDHYISLFINVTKTDEDNPAKNGCDPGTGPPPVVQTIEPSRLCPSVQGPADSLYLLEGLVSNDDSHVTIGVVEHVRAVEPGNRLQLVELQELFFLCPSPRTVYRVHLRRHLPGP